MHHDELGPLMRSRIATPPLDQVRAIHGDVSGRIEAALTQAHLTTQ